MPQQDQQILLDLEVVDQPRRSLEECIKPAEASLQDVQASLRTTLHPGRKSDRLDWESTQGRQSEKILTQSQQIQSSLSVPTLSSLCQDMWVF